MQQLKPATRSAPKEEKAPKKNSKKKGKNMSPGTTVVRSVGLKHI
jgi:hypothetical protein